MADALFGSEGFFPSEISNAIFKTLDESIIPRMRSSVLPLDSLADKLEVLKPTTINKDEKAKRKLQKMKQRNQPIPVGSLIQIFENGQLVSVVDDETADEVTTTSHPFVLYCLCCCGFRFYAKQVHYAAFF